MKLYRANYSVGEIMIINSKYLFLSIFFWTLSTSSSMGSEKICDHEVVLDAQNRLQPWTSYDNVIRWSMNFINFCPTINTKFGEDPFYLVTAEFNEDGAFFKKQNNQGSNVYWAVETLKKYYAYCGDKKAFLPVKRLIERVALYFTPAGWVWPNVPRTQDDSPDGEYTDEWSEVDKMCMVALGYIEYFKLTGEKDYYEKAVGIAQTVMKHVAPGDATHSPLPFRVNLKTGGVLDPYCSNMIMPIKLLDELQALINNTDKNDLLNKRKILWEWLLKYPLQNNCWSGYYEDVVSNYNNLNQQNPMETARYLLCYPETDAAYQSHVPALLAWVKNRFGQTKRCGATSIKEQDGCFKEMSSHTARYASVMAMWFGVTQNPLDREEAYASFALSTYSAYNQYSHDSLAINYVGIEYTNPWLSDSYWDYLSHYFDGMKELPEMLPENENHLFYSSSVVNQIDYDQTQICYRTFDADGVEYIKLRFEPTVFVEGKEYSSANWTFGRYRGVDNILMIHRNKVRQVEIFKKGSLNANQKRPEF